MSARCADVSAAAGEPLAATAVTATRWLLIEAPGPWPRDVAAADGLPDAARTAVRSWLDATPRSRLQLVRRPGRAARRPLVFVVDAEETRSAVRRIELEAYEDLAFVDPDTHGSPSAGSIVLVCGHGSRDRCCVLRGTAVYRALDAGLEDESLWVSSHQGGHRFAANVLVLPAGLQFGRVGPHEAPALVERALDGRIDLERYRGRTCYEGVVQAAEHAIRSAAGVDGADDLLLVGAENGLVRFRATDGRELAAIVDEVTGPAVSASCGDDPAPQRSFAARVVR
jgi:hypothetical protein